eukprot:TRINITY_DN5533_c0_g1_i1.p1 TRINITY_DN5533_c0_g1~~TRINITY_DN5533_c0_g1_i1.p1  ORF type:complete len:360 (+),score=77.73 TRINITY_DN5533_c0_g1_i1:126-1205(+)
MASKKTGLTGVMGLANKTGGLLSKDKVGTAVAGYEKFFEEDNEQTSGSRKLNYTDLVNKYYDLATSFYEYGWGEAFHFAHRWNGETLRESIKRHEHYLALKLALKPGMKVLDVGCGIGGPLREIARFSGASITGLNNNEYQITRGTVLNKRVGIEKTCDFVKADFMNIPKPDNSYDAVYAIEATCHAPDSVGCYSEVKRVLKPGAYFACYEWCMTDAYNPADETQRKIKSDILLGNGLPDLQTCSEARAAVEKAGFEIIEAIDLCNTAEVPWYAPLDPSNFSLSSFRLSAIGRFVTKIMVWWLETLRLAPAGTCQVHHFLEKGAFALVEGGRRELFTPQYFFLARKPLDAVKRIPSMHE